MKGLIEAMTRFKAIMAKLPAKPSQAEYEVVRNAYYAVHTIFGEEGMAKIWEKVKAKDPTVAAFKKFGDARTYRYHQTDEYKAYQREYQATWGAKPENAAKKAAARRKYKDKLKAWKAQVSQ